MIKLYKLNKTVLKFTNNPEKIFDGLSSNTSDKPTNAFLDRFGKIIVTFEQLKKNNSIYILIESKFYKRLMDHLNKYLKISKVLITKLEYNVYYDLESEYKINDNEFSFKKHIGRIIVTAKDINSISDTEFLKFRLDNNVALQGIDYDQEMILNINNNFVSFTKGCFLGQEIVARVNYRSKPPKKLIVVNDNNDKMTSVINGRGFMLINT